MSDFTGYDAYVTYLAFKFHFAEGNTYDFFKYGGKTKASVGSFEKRKDRYYFDKLAVKFGRDKFLGKLLVEQIHNRDFWVKDLLTKDNEDRYLKWLGYYEAFDYSFKKDLSYIREYCLRSDIDLSEIFKITDGHPIIFRFLIRKEIAIETFMCLDSVIGFTHKINQKFNADPIWIESFSLMNRYHPFIVSKLPDRKKILRLMKEALN
jgi:hypothetical protein